MKIVTPEAHIVRGKATEKQMRDGIIRRIEYAARKCYRSEDLICEGSGEKLLHSLVQRGHWAMLEHASIMVEFNADRGVCNEIVRHRIAAYAQESTRYCNYSKDKFDGEVRYTDPFLALYIDPKTKGLSAEEKVMLINEWLDACIDSEKHYMRMLELGASPQIARLALNLGTMSSMVMTANLREWKHFFDLRSDGITGPPHPQMLEIVRPLQREFQRLLPEVFGEVTPE